jgi:hypothetical protein
MGINRDEKGVLKIKATFFSKDSLDVTKLYPELP